ncbi:MAG: universal stress protein [Verrucomicrobiota bacterium]|jgi:nucleotide-binding universal stress UspA family protein
MSAKRILLPLDLLHSKTDTLLYLQQMALDSPFCATLLYVVELNITPPVERLYQELRDEAQSSLASLSRLFFGHQQAARLCVRFGRPDEQIIAEAGASHSELILMSSSRPRRWHHLFHSRTVERVVQFAPCPTLVLPLSWQAPPASRPRPLASPQKSARPSGSLPHPTWTSWAGA